MALLVFGTGSDAWIIQPNPLERVTSALSRIKVPFSISIDAFETQQTPMEPAKILAAAFVSARQRASDDTEIVVHAALATLHSAANKVRRSERAEHQEGELKDNLEALTAGYLGLTAASALALGVAGAPLALGAAAAPLALAPATACAVATVIDPAGDTSLVTRGFGRALWRDARRGAAYANAFTKRLFERSLAARANARAYVTVADEVAQRRARRQEARAIVEEAVARAEASLAQYQTFGVS